jgi:enoyl-CoA hydratase
VTYEHIETDTVGTDDRVGRITINRPEVLNALAAQTYGELEDALRRYEADDSIRVVILRGGGRAFSVGHDLSDVSRYPSPHDPEREYRVRDEQDRPLGANLATAFRQVTDIYMYLWNMSTVSIVQTHGYCLAGGMELAMMGDLVTTSSDCVFGHPAHRGVGVARNAMILPLVIGMRKAKELLYTGDGINGEQALEMGLVNYAWPVDELERRTIELADRVANQSSDFLSVIKSVANRFYENMGIYSSVHNATQADAFIQQTASSYEWDERYRRDGLRAALAWRDGQYGDYSARPRS